jgi:hypothetical protein
MIESHVLLEKIKTTIKICGISKQNMCFLLQSPYNSSHSPKIVSKNPPKKSLLPQIFPLWVVPNHIIMIQNQFKTITLHEQSLS